MDFIGTGNRILTENFVIGYLYTITFTNGNYINSACTGIGADFVMFSRTQPEYTFALTMETASDVSGIDLYTGGTDDYNDLENKPQINSVTLTGNLSLSDLGIQPVINSDNMLSADLIDDTSSTNKFATAAQLSQIETNKNNILSEQAKTIGMGKGGSNYIQVNGIKMYFDTNAPTGASVGDVWITGTGSIKYKSENLLDFSAWANGVTVVRGTMTVNSDSVSITSTAATCFTGWNTTEYPNSARIAVTEGDVIQFAWECDVDDNSNVWIFPNASVTGSVSVSATTKFLQYTVPNGVNYITFRLDVMTANKTFTYSNLSITAWK